MPNVVTICGSLRKGSFNRMLANALPGLAPEGMTITAAPSIDMPLYNADVQAQGFPSAATALADAIRTADGVVIVSPEYNWSMPGVLKNAIDWMSRMKEPPFGGKPVALQSASTGLLGGSRMQYHLRQSLTSIDAQILGRPEVVVTFAKDKFDEATGELKDGATREVIRQQLAAFVPYMRRFSRTD
jgi:chromate reductase